MGPFQQPRHIDADEEDDDEDGPTIVDENHSNTDSESDDNDITFAPDDFEPMFGAIKANRFGFGYIGLNKDPVLQKHLNLFSPFEVFDKNNKKVYLIKVYFLFFLV